MWDMEVIMFSILIDFFMFPIHCTCNETQVPIKLPQYMCIHCGMSMIIRYIGETMQDATPWGGREGEVGK